jgi:hypothetical protein
MNNKLLSCHYLDRMEYFFIINYTIIKRISTRKTTYEIIKKKIAKKIIFTKIKKCYNLILKK